MLWFFWGFLSVMLKLCSVHIAMSLCLLMPCLVVSTYKVFSYVEDGLMMHTNINMVLVFLTLSLTLLVMLSCWYMREAKYNFLTLLLSLVLVSCFLSSSLLSFYVLFELSLLPILFLVIGWGYQPERIQASMYMVMYTVLASMPLMVVIFYLNMHYSSLSINILSLGALSAPAGLWFLGSMAFLVKLPVYGVHIWLPKAHVEAPLGGSMMLAGVLLKLGGYGLYLYTNMVPWVNTSYGMCFIISFAMWGGSLAAWHCFNQNDIKAMIAYSSIVHMSIVVMGFMSTSTWGQVSAIITMVAHGWVSSGLFLMAYITYTLVGSRSFNYTKGLLQVVPVASMSWFVYCIWNMAVPPTINLVGELAIIPVSWMLSFKMLLVVLMVMFLSVGYNMYLYMYMNHGPTSGYITMFKPLSSAMFLPIMGHLMPLVLLFNMDLLYY
uniref:NADH-ubiquinone oxidoreductase chain 4 n=1 Tax=Helix pomatia TaxID=6536 RepID=A0A481ZKZ2_HELPO|nr:NADH dehydrogenase subunit 4 [Helix pomatia]